MRWSLKIINIDKDKFTVSLRDTSEIFSLPLKLLPGGGRKGDILTMDINFNPFDTLKSIKQAEKNCY